MSVHWITEDDGEDVCAETLLTYGDLLRVTFHEYDVEGAAFSLGGVIETHASFRLTLTVDEAEALSHKLEDFVNEARAYMVQP